MARRDYARRGSKKKKNQKGNKITLLLIAGVLISSFAVALFLMKQKAPEKVVAVPKVDNTQPKSVLPNRPEEVWSYIQALETRTVPVNNDPMSLDKNMRLTEEQKKILLAMEQEQKAAEQARLKQQEELKKAEDIAKKETALSVTTPAVKPELKTDSTKSANKPSVVVEAKKSESAKDTIKVESTKKVEKADVVTITASERKYGLQCGAFKNKTQAENLQARLVIAGLNARVNSNAEWNRVIVGPVSDRVSAVRAQEKARTITNCVVIGM